MQRIVSIWYRSQIFFDGPVQLSCGIGATRRELVIRPSRSVRVWTFERRIASRPGGFVVLLLVAEVVRRRAVIANDGRLRMVVVVIEKSVCYWGDE